MGKTQCFWSQSFAIVATADKSAPKGILSSKVIIGTYENDKPQTLNVAWGSPTLEYKGLNINLTLPTEVSALSKHVTIKNIQIKNPNKQSLTDAWLYVKGDVENLSIGSTLGVGNWIRVTDNGIPENDVISCDLEFDYTKNTDGNVEIYVLSGFSSSLDPSGKSIEELKDNVGEKRTIPIRMGEVVLSGELSVDDAELKYNTDYVLTARITSEASNASILNPKMEITIPENQVIQTAELEYGTTIVDYTKLTARLSGLNAIKFTFDLAKALDQATVILPGIWDTESKLPREAKLKITYRPMCKTSSSGIRFTGVVKADTPFEGGTVNSRNVRSAYMFPYDNLTYKFQVAIETTSGNYAFNELTNQSEIKIKLNLSRKAEVKETDKLKLAIPEYLTITGDIQWSSEKGFMLDPFKSSDLTPDDSDPMLYTLSLPANAFNADKDDVITYVIPVTYTKPSDNEELSILAGNPVVAVEVNVATQGEAFGGIACGNEPTEASAGMGSRDFAFVLTDKNFPLHAFIGSSSDITVTSGQFNGNWQVGSVNFNTPGCSFTPGTSYTDATPEIETGVIEEATINVKISDKEYGSVKAQFKVFPSLDFALKGDYFTECSALGEVSLANYVDNITSQYTTVKFYSDENCEPADEVIGNVAINATVNYWAKAENNGGSGNKVGTMISFVINTPVTVTTPEDASNPSLIYEHNATVNLRVTATGTLPENGSFAYQWYKDGTALSGKTSANLEITAANQSNSGTYYVWVNGGVCGNVKSEEVEVTVYPNLAINLHQSSLTVCSNDQIGVDLYGNIKEYVDNVTYWYSTESDGSDLIELSANNPIPVPSLTTGSYWIYSKHSAATTTTPVELSLKIEKATRIITPPNNISIPRGGNLVLSVTAEGEGTLSYQWQKKVGNDFVDITTVENPTATLSTFTISPAEYTNAGDYRVKVKAEGTVCETEVISAVANVNVYTPSQEIIYQVTYEASIGGELSVTYQGWPILSGNYVDNGSRLEVNAHVRMAGLYLASLTVNGAEIENGQSITINSDTHIVAVFEMEGSDPNPDPTGNTEVVNPAEIWTEKGQLYIRSDRAGRVKVIDFSGRIYADRSMMEGETIIPLPKGLYIVVLSDGTTKKIVMSGK